MIGGKRGPDCAAATSLPQLSGASATWRRGASTAMMPSARGATDLRVFAAAAGASRLRLVDGHAVAEVRYRRGDSTQFEARDPDLAWWEPFLYVWIVVVVVVLQATPLRPHSATRPFTGGACPWAVSRASRFHYPNAKSFFVPAASSAELLRTATTSETRDFRARAV